MDFYYRNTPGACLPSSLSPCRETHHLPPKVTTDQIKTGVTKRQEERSCRMLQLLTSKQQTLPSSLFEYQQRVRLEKNTGSFSIYTYAESLANPFSKSKKIFLKPQGFSVVSFSRGCCQKVLQKPW